MSETLHPAHPTPPAFDASALARLASEVDDTTYPTVFATRYQSMLPQRVGRIAEALGHADLEVALDAVLSLRVSSTTVGTCELAEIAGDIEASVRRQDLASARMSARRLAVVASRAHLALGGYLAAAV